MCIKIVVLKGILSQTQFTLKIGVFHHLYPPHLIVVVAEPTSLQYGPVVSGGQTHWKPPLLLMQVPPLWQGFWKRIQNMFCARVPIYILEF